MWLLGGPIQESWFMSKMPLLYGIRNNRRRWRNPQALGTSLWRCELRRKCRWPYDINFECFECQSRDYAMCFVTITLLSRIRVFRNRLFCQCARLWLQKFSGLEKRMVRQIWPIFLWSCWLHTDVVLCVSSFSIETPDGRFIGGCVGVPVTSWTAYEMWVSSTRSMLCCLVK